MGQNQLKVRHFFEQSFIISFFAESRVNQKRLAGFGQPLGNRSEFHGCEVMPERMRLDADKSFFIFIFFILLDLIIFAPGIYKNPAQKFIRILSDGIKYLFIIRIRRKGIWLSQNPDIAMVGKIGNKCFPYTSRERIFQ